MSSLWNEKYAVIKTSNSEICNKNWIFQVFLYNILNNINNTDSFNNIYIVNILRGVIYKINFYEFLEEKQVLNIILDKYKFITDLKHNFLEKIFKEKN